MNEHELLKALKEEIEYDPYEDLFDNSTDEGKAYIRGYRALQCRLKEILKELK